MTSYKPTESFHILLTKNIVWSVLGIILGIINNNIIVLLCNIFNIQILFVQNSLQLFACSLILTTIQYCFNYFGWSWQNITPGLFFISFFFGIQYHIFTNIQNTYIHK
jgi:hypothetical protein